MEHLTDIGVIKDIFERHGFSFSKTLGQNFLVNPSVCPRIAEMGNAKRGFGVIEIGPGIGVLTNELCKRADKVVAIEIDDRLIPILEKTLAEHKNVKIINDDVLNVDLKKLIEEEFAGLDVAVCANLPYYITSPIIMMRLESRLPIKTITTMVQKEAGQRLCAPVGTRDMGAVTVAVNYFSNAKILFNVSRGSFMPAPNVDSCVIQFEIKDTPPMVSDEKYFFKVVRGMFSQRRKTILNCVSGSLGITKNTVLEAIEQTGLKPAARPEELSMQELILFCENLKSAVE